MLNMRQKYLVFVRFDVHGPLMGVSILIPLLSKVAGNISINHWLNNCQTLQNHHMKRINIKHVEYRGADRQMLSEIMLTYMLK